MIKCPKCQSNNLKAPWDCKFKLCEFYNRWKLVVYIVCQDCGNSFNYMEFYDKDVNKEEVIKELNKQLK